MSPQVELDNTKAQFEQVEGIETRSDGTKLIENTDHTMALELYEGTGSTIIHGRLADYTFTRFTLRCDVDGTTIIMNAPFLWEVEERNYGPGAIEQIVSAYIVDQTIGEEPQNLPRFQIVEYSTWQAGTGRYTTRDGGVGCISDHLPPSDDKSQDILTRISRERRRLHGYGFLFDKEAPVQINVPLAVAGFMNNALNIIRARSFDYPPNVADFKTK